eukprot:18367-Heterococcus_DN1.PRE.4
MEAALDKFMSVACCDRAATAQLIAAGNDLDVAFNTFLTQTQVIDVDEAADGSACTESDANSADKHDTKPVHIMKNCGCLLLAASQTQAPGPARKKQDL